MAFYGSIVEYGLHCLLHLVAPRDSPGEGGVGDAPLSSRDLAAYQDLPPAYVAKLFTRLEKAGLVTSEAGLRGGYRLARAADAITVLDVVDALDGGKPLFHCREIRRDCVLFERKPPGWAVSGPCAIHAVMRGAEQQMRLALAATTLADLANSVAGKIPAEFVQARKDWFRGRTRERLTARGRRKRF